MKRNFTAIGKNDHHAKRRRLENNSSGGKGMALQRYQTPKPPQQTRTDRRLEGVTSSRTPMSSWMHKKAAVAWTGTNPQDRVSNVLALKRVVKGEKPIRLNPRNDAVAGWIKPLRKAVNFEKLPPLTPNQWNIWAHAHWKFSDYRNRIGVFMKHEDLREFIRPFHFLPNGFATRFLKRYKDMAFQGRINLQNDITFARRHQPPIFDTKCPLSEIKKSWAARKFLARVLRLKSPAAVLKVCDRTLAYIVEFIRMGYNHGPKIMTRTMKYAKSGPLKEGDVPEKGDGNEDCENDWPEPGVGLDTEGIGLDDGREEEHQQSGGEDENSGSDDD